MPQPCTKVVWEQTTSDALLGHTVLQEAVLYIAVRMVRKRKVTEEDKLADSKLLTQNIHMVSHDGRNYVHVQLLNKSEI